MSDIIKLLPDAVANQIAAGEVIQRPASVIKELIENAVDAGCTNIQVFIKDAGKTSIQVIDNGCGMSPMDARMAFERHATSKINDAKDLFAIRTLGFRGEALASIAAVSEIKLRTKPLEDELGTEIEVAASNFISQEPVACPAGSNFLVRNLFFNTPARRKFLKANTTELKHIISEFQRVALTHPEIEMTLHHNNVEIYNLPQSIYRQRICNVFGKSINQYLIPINADTSIVKISGFIGKPEAAKKTAGEQFLFANQRYIRHPFLHRAIMKAYEQLLPADAIPSYFIYFEVDPETIDINIHPTKTEVKFEDEQSIFQILLASLKEALGKFNIVPSLDFTIDTSVDIPVARKGDDIKIPSININPDYNPFETDMPQKTRRQPLNPELEKDNLENWDKLYQGFENQSGSKIYQSERMDDSGQAEMEGNKENITNHAFQLKNKYILIPVKSGLMIIDQKRAHERVLYEKYLSLIHYQKGVSQQSLFPERIELTKPEMQCLNEISDEIKALGFDIIIDKTKVEIKGYPSDAISLNIGGLFKEIIQACMDESLDLEAGRKEKIAMQMARSSAIPYGKSLTNEEMHDLVDHLFGCEMPNFTPFGKTTLQIFNLDEIDKRF